MRYMRYEMGFRALTSHGVVLEKLSILRRIYVQTRQQFILFY